VAIATPLILPFLHQPLMEDYLPIFWMILLATMLRVAADAYGFILLALHRDRAIAVIAAGGIGRLESHLHPAGGLRGAVLAEPS
jgi:O-antigen/teichoic acid export membrane protein